MNVDRRLVTNVLLSFLSTPRADSKRFEMLSLLASILSWNDQEREKAGLQRIHPSEGPQASSFWGRTSTTTSPSRAGSELEKSDETEVCLVCLYRDINSDTLLFVSLSPGYGWSSCSQKQPPGSHPPRPLLRSHGAARHQYQEVQLDTPTLDRRGDYPH